MTCDATAGSLDTPGHVHTCSGKHDQFKEHPHFCPECRRWWFLG